MVAWVGFSLAFLLGLIVGSLIVFCIVEYKSWKLVRETMTFPMPFNWRVFVGSEFYFNWLKKKEAK